MYVPAHFAELQTDVMHGLIQAHPLATLVTLSNEGIDANHLPLHLSPAEGPFGTLRGHIARTNPLWRGSIPDSEALAVFHGPDSYISPSWYPTKSEDGKAVPTWNYVVVHALGTLRVIDDATWLRSHLESLTAHNEAAFAEPWRVSDAPRDFTEKLITALVGIEFAITRLTGKWKVSQNQPPQNRAGVVRGLRANSAICAEEMAALVEGSSRVGTTR